jgi:type I restriction enzyme M protein
MSKVNNQNKSSYNTWKLARMNLAIRIDANLGPRKADSFRADLHSDLKADFILSNPPFNMSDWGDENLRQDVRWRCGMPPVNNANYAWIQHFIHHLSSVGVVGFVMASVSARHPFARSQIHHQSHRSLCLLN